VKTCEAKMGTRTRETEPGSVMTRGYPSRLSHRMWTVETASMRNT
jgi:hypothetical protein